MFTGILINAEEGVVCSHYAIPGLNQGFSFGKVPDFSIIENNFFPEDMTSVKLNFEGSNYMLWIGDSCMVDGSKKILIDSTEYAGNAFLYPITNNHQHLVGLTIERTESLLKLMKNISF